MQMIKTFIALLSVTSVAFAVDTTRVFDLENNVVADDALGYLYSYDPSTHFGTFEDDANVSGDLFTTMANGKIQTNVTFTLDLTDVMAAAARSEFTTPVVLVNLDLNAMDIGLYLTAEGIGFGKAYNSLQGTTLRYDSLLSNPYSFEGTSGHAYITLTFAQHQNGIKILDNNASTELVTNGYKSASNSSLNSISVNTEYIEGVQFYNAWPTNGNFTDVNEGFDLAMKGKLCPEPATAMLSLLALAGLAARRRRK